MEPIWPRTQKKCNPFLLLEVLFHDMRDLVGSLSPPLYGDAI